VLALNVSRSAAAPGDADLHVTGTLEPAGNAVGLWFEGDRGWWLLPAGLPDVTLPQAPTFALSAALARDAPQGPQVLKAAALSVDGAAGTARSWPLEVGEPALPAGALVVSLRWDTDADLDLHVVDSRGVEIWARNPNSWQAEPGAPIDPNAWKQGGLLDADSNAQCAIDGRNAERVVWGAAAPPGRYQVRVDAFSLCGQRTARWTVEVFAQGRRVGHAEGVATAESTRPPHDLGAGVLALEFELP
jgi:hypothetical protein